MKKGISLSIALLIILLDQLSKYWAISHLVPFESVPVLPILSWSLAFNSGSAFSFLANAGAWHMWFFMGLSTVISVGLIIWIFKLDANHKHGFYQMLALVFILGGAIGNLIDRIKIGYVIDFIDVYYKSYHWPVFNLADTAICIGGAWLALVWLREH